MPPDGANLSWTAASGVRLSRYVPIGSSYPNNSYYCNLLYQDLSNTFVPHRDFEEPEPYVLRSDPEDVIWEVSRALSLRGSHGHRGADEFVSSVGLRLFVDRVVWLEVFDDGERGFGVSDIEPSTVRRAGSKLLQTIPDDFVAPDWFYSDEPLATGTVELDPGRIVKVELPTAYPSQLLDEVISGLSVLSAHQLGPSWLGREEVPGFDFRAHRRLLETAVIQSALPIGWTAREIFGGNSRVANDYYHYYRELKFLHFRLALRERAEEALEEVLRIAGQACGFEVTLERNGLASVARALGAQRQFERGDLTFSDIGDLIFERLEGDEAR